MILNWKIKFTSYAALTKIHEIILLSYLAKANFIGCTKIKY